MKIFRAERSHREEEARIGLTETLVKLKSSRWLKQVEILEEGWSGGGKK